MFIIPPHSRTSIRRRSVIQACHGTLVRVHSPCVSRCFSEDISRKTNHVAEVKNVAILGGGITGLTTAFYLSKFLPETRITLFEGSSRLGGWLHSKQVDVGNGKVVFEQGPRTLRPNVPNGLVTLKLVCHIPHFRLHMLNGCVDPGS